MRRLIVILITVSIWATGPKSLAQLSTGKVDSLLERSIQYEQKSLDSSLQISARALKLSQTLKNDTVLGKAYLTRATQYLKSGQSQLALPLYRKAINIYKGIDDLKLLAGAHYSLGYFHYYQKQYDSSLYYFVKAKDSAEKLGNADILASSSMGIATHYYYFKQDYSQALDLFKQALKSYTRQENHEGKAGCLIFMGLTYMNLSQNDSAAQAYQEALEITQQNDLQARSIEAHSYLAKLQEQTGQRLQAFKNTREALELAQQTGSKQQEARLSASISRLIFDTIGMSDELQKAHQQFLSQYGGLASFLEKTEDDVKRFGMIHTQLHFYDYLKQYYHQKGNYQKAFQYGERYHELNDSIQNKTKTEAIASIEERYETAEKEKELLQAEARMKELAQNRKLERLYYIAALALVLLLGFLFFYRARLNKANAQRAIKEKALAESEASVHRKQNEIAQKDLQLKERELTAHTLSIMRKNELISRVQDKLSELNSSDAQSLQSTLNNNRIQDKDWKRFNDSFKSTHPSFYPRLLEINSKLTNGDLRLAALIKLGMNNREIANLLSIANSSVDQAKYRLKKKLDIHSEESLESFLLQLTAKEIEVKMQKFSTL